MKMLNLLKFGTRGMYSSGMTKTLGIVVNHFHQNLVVVISHMSGNIEQYYLTIAGGTVASLAYFFIQKF